MGSIDASIPLGTTLPQSRSPLATLGALGQLDQQRQAGQQRDLMNEQRRRALEDDDAIRSTLARTGNPDDAIEELYQGGRPDAAGALGKQIYDWRKTKAEQLKLELGNAHDKLKLATQIAQGITNQSSLDTGRRAINALLTPVLGQDITEQFGTEYDPDRITQLAAWGTERTQFLKQQQDAIDNGMKAIEMGRKLGADGDARAKTRAEQDAQWTKSAAGFLSTARSQEQVDAFQRALLIGGAPPAVLAKFGNEYSPAYAANATTLGMDPKERADVADRKVTQSQGQQNINLRTQELERQKAEAAGGPSARPLTANQKKDVEKRHYTAYAKLQKEIDANWKNPDTGTVSIPDEAKSEIAARKLEIEEAYRAEMGLAPLADTEFELSRDPSKAKELRQIRNTYRKVTGEAAPLERLETLAKQVAAEKDPRKAGPLKLQLAELRLQQATDPATAERLQKIVETLRSTYGNDQTGR